MKKTKGFTLAEVLVGLSIVGIAAALTVPQLVKSIQKVETGPKLSRAVQQFEVSSQDYFNYRTKKDEKASHYTKFSDINEVSLDELATFWGLTPITNGPAFNIDKYAEYAYVKQPLLIQSAYAAIQDSWNSIEDKTLIGDLDNPGEDSLKEELKRNCYNILTGEGCEEGAPGCNCQKGPVAKPGDPINPCLIGEIYDPATGKCTQIVFPPNDPDPEPEPEPEPEPDNPSSKYQAYHSKKGGYDIYFDGDKINTTGKSNNEDIVASFYLDTNGTKNRPNMKGKDLFKFDLRNDGKLEPEGLKNNSYVNNCADSGVKDGLACTARIIRDGYKIKY